MLGVAAVLLLMPRLAAAEVVCRPAAMVSGDADVAGEIAQELARHDIDVQPAPSCARVVAEVRHDGDFLAIDVTDAAGRRSQRRVAHGGEAVSVIESWARPDANADLLVGFVVEPAAPEVTTVPEVRDVVLPPVSTRRRDVLTVAVSGDVSIDRASAGWAGGTAMGCVAVGGLCAGGIAHLRRSAAAATRVEASLLAGVDLPLRLGQVGVMPGLAAGVARASLTMSVGGQNQETIAWDARAEAHVIVSYPLARWLFAELTVAVDAAPFPRDRQAQEGVPSPIEADLFLRAGAGLRVGAP